VIWLLAGAGMLAGAAFPGLLELLANVMGVRDTNVALFSVVLAAAARAGAQFSVLMSRQADQITGWRRNWRLEKARAQRLESAESDEAQAAVGKDAGRPE